MEVTEGGKNVRERERGRERKREREKERKEDLCRTSGWESTISGRKAL